MPNQSNPKEYRLSTLGLLDDNTARVEIGLPVILGWKCTTCNCICTEPEVFKYHHIPGTDHQCKNPILERLTSYFEMLEANETINKIVNQKLDSKKSEKSIRFREWL